MANEHNEPEFNHSVPNFSKKGKGLSMIGFYDMTTPSGVLLRDPELVKSVLVTNFHKAKNIASVDPKKDPILAENPFFTERDKWKSQRAQLTRMLSASKLKMIWNQVNNVCEKMGCFISKKMKVSGTVVEFEMNRLFSRYTSEIVANSVFGVEGYSFDDNCKGRSFLEIGESVFDPSIKTGLKFNLTRVSFHLYAGFLTLDFTRRH